MVLTKHGLQQDVTGVGINHLVDDYLLVKFSVKMGNDEHRSWSFLVHEPDVDRAHFLWELLPALSRRLARQVFHVIPEPPLDAAVGKLPTC